jgi:hypothetical protein
LVADSDFEEIVSLKDSSRNRILGVGWDQDVPDDAPVVSISAVTAASGTLRIEVSEAAAAGGCVLAMHITTSVLSMRQRPLGPPL